MIGSGAGNTYSGQMGVDRALIVDGPSASLGALSKMNDAWSLQQKELAAQRKAARANATALLTKPLPEFFYRHQKEIADAQNSVFTAARDLMAKGIDDPFSDVSEESLALQRKYHEVLRMAQVSKQVKDQAEGAKTTLAGKQIDDFDGESLVAMNSFLDKPLAEHLQSPMQAPIILGRTPIMDAVKRAREVAAPVDAQYGGKGDAPKEAYTEAAIQDMKNPEIASKLAQSYAYQYRTLTPELRAEVDEQARAIGADVATAMHVKNVLGARKMKPVLSASDLIGEAAKIDAPSIKWENDRVQVEKVDAKAYKNKLAAEVKRLVMDNPSAVDDYAAYFGMKREDEESERDFFARVEIALAKEADKLIDKKSSTQFKDAAAKADRKQKEGSKWLENLKSGSPELSVDAANHLVNTKLSDGSIIEDTYIVKDGMVPEGTGDEQSSEKGSQRSGKYVVMKLVSPTRYALPSTNKDGEPVEERQGRAVRWINFRIDGSDNNNNDLMQLFLAGENEYRQLEKSVDKSKKQAYAPAGRAANF